MIFDDIVSDENGKSAWTYVCAKHAPIVQREYHGAIEEGCLDDVCCGVEGCEDYGANDYFTFYADNHLVVSN